MDSRASWRISDSTFSSCMTESDNISSSSRSGAQIFPADSPEFREVDAVHELHRPKLGPPSIELVFFHGLHLGDYSEAYLKAWMNQNQSQTWIATWLVEKFPQSRVLSVSYDSSISKSTAKDGSVSLAAVAEAFLTHLIEIKCVGDTQCPIVLIGHSLGGLVIKEICSHAERLSKVHAESPRVVPFKKFLSSVKGTFFYATPSGGSLQRELAAIISTEEFFHTPKYLALLNRDTARIGEDFSKLRRKYGWKTYGVGEADETVISGTGSVIHVEVKQISFDMDIISKMMGTNHINIIQPAEKTSESFPCLADFVTNILHDQEDAENEDFMLYCGLPEHGVSLEGRVEHVVQQLQLREQHPLMLGLVGMGGIGKTTLARAVFLEIHSSFEFSSFVYNAKEALRLRSLDALVKDNLYKGDKKDVRTSSNQSVSVWKTLKGKKVLLVIDDVDSREQISVISSMIESNWFGKSTRVIITSRVCSEDILHEYINLEVRGLNQDESRTLFCKHADNPEVPVELVNRLVAQCGGLPLTLEIVGAYLRNETDVKVWEETVGRLQRAESASGTVDDRLWNKLRLCYDSLETTEREMFLDLATVFYDHHDLGLLKAAWKRSIETPEVGLKNLVARCLIRIVQQATKNDVDCGLILKRERVWMHAQLRDMGQVIASKSRRKIDLSTSLGHDNPTSATSVLVTTSATGESLIKGLKITYFANGQSRDLRTKISATCFSLPELRYLFLENVDISGFIVKFPPNLALLSLHFCRRVLASSSMSWHNWPIRDTDLASLDNLAALEICTDPKIDPPESPGSSSSSSTKSTLPTGFHKLAQLRVLLLRSSAVKELPLKFGHLPRLEYLDLRTRELAALPDTFGKLSTLQKLCLQCRALEKLPASFAELKSLRNLELHSLAVDELPENFGNLGALRTLDIYSCQKLFSLPESIGRLTSLESLMLSSCNKLTLPESFGQLQGLQSLEIRYCERLKGLPESFGQLHSLHSLKLLHFYELAELPDSFGQLGSLQDLEMVQCLGLRKLPESFGELRALRKLKIIECYDLAALPATFGQLGALQSLTINRSQLRTLPESFGRLKSLQTLRLEKLPSLRSLPESLGRLATLKTLMIYQCENLPFLPNSFGHLRGLQRLEMELQCRIFTKLPDSFGRLAALQTLKILSCHLQSLPHSIGGLTALEKMRISVSKGVKVLPDIPDSFEQLAVLQELIVEVPPKAMTMDVLSVWLEKLEDMGWICTQGTEEGVYTFAKVSRHPPSVFDFAHYMHKRRGVECVCAAPSRHSGRQSRGRTDNLL